MSVDSIPFTVAPAFEKLARLSQLRRLFGFFAMSFMVKACVFIVGL